ncbi:dihydrodipicolinate reductase C-terminal domain-containing protein [Mycoplasmatota bacterium WC44]
MKNIVIVGIFGRMGKYVHNILEGREEFHVIAGIANQMQYSRVESYRHLDEIINNKNIDLVVDFSNAKAIDNLITALNNKVPVITGTTGYTNDEKTKLYKLAKKNNVSLMMISNFAYGASIMYKLLKELDYNFEKKDILEVHHVKKKDKPSGTAKEYAKAMNIPVERVQSIRLNDVIASHEAIFDSPGEKLIIRHEIYHRDAFLKGLLKSLDIIFRRRIWIRDLEEYNKLGN